MNYLKKNKDITPINESGVSTVSDPLVFQKLVELSDDVTIWSPLPALEDVSKLEKKYNIQLPESYKTYLLKYSNLNVGTYEMFVLNDVDWSHVDLETNIIDAYLSWLDKEYFPFMMDNWDYFCFDLCSGNWWTDYEVVYFSQHWVFQEERWSNFLKWVEKDWLEL